MDTMQQQVIRESAYHKWEQSGAPLGDDLKFWLQAEQEFLSHQKPEPQTGFDVVEETSEESFPASDAPAWKMTTVGVHSQQTGRSKKKP